MSTPLDLDDYEVFDGFHDYACVALHDEKEEHPHECNLIKKYLQKSGYKVAISKLRHISAADDRLPVIESKKLILYITCHGNNNSLNSKAPSKYWNYLRILRQHSEEFLIVICACHSGTLVKWFEKECDMLLCTTCNSKHTKSLTDCSNIDPQCILTNQTTNLLTGKWIYHPDMIEEMGNVAGNAFVKNGKRFIDLNNLINKLKGLQYIQDLDNTDLFLPCEQKKCEKIHAHFGKIEKDGKRYVPLDTNFSNKIRDWRLIPRYLIIRYEIGDQVVRALQERCGPCGLLKKPDVIITKVREFIFKNKPLIKQLDVFDFKIRDAETDKIIFHFDNLDGPKWSTKCFEDANPDSSCLGLITKRRPYYCDVIFPLRKPSKSSDIPLK